MQRFCNCITIISILKIILTLNGLDFNFQLYYYFTLQIVFAFLVLAHPGSPGKRAVKRCMCVNEK